MDYIKVGFFAFDMVVLIFLILYLLGGFLKGWKKTLFNLIAFLVPFVIFMLMADPLAKLLMQVEWPVIGNIQEYIKESSGMKFGESSEELLLASSAAIVKLALYELGISLCFLIASLNRLIFKLTLKKFFYPGGDTKIKPSMPSRLIGLGCGFGRFILAMVVLFFPIFGAINVTQNMLSDFIVVNEFVEKIEDVNEEQVALEELDIESIYDLLDTSISYKIFSSMKNSQTDVSLPASYLGSIMSVKTTNGTHNLVNNYGQLHAILKVISKIEVEGDYISFENLTTSDIETLKKAVKKLDIIKLIAPSAKEIIIDALKDGDLDNKEELIEVLTVMDVEEEIDILLNSISELFGILKNSKINIANPEEILLDKNLSEVSEKVLTSLVSSKTIQEFVLPYVCEAIIDALDDETNQMEQVITKENLKKCIETDISELITIYQDLSNNINLHNYIFNEEELNIESDNAASSLEVSVEKLFNLSIIKGNEKQIITFALSKAEQESLQYDKLFNDLVVNWQDEGKIIGTILKEIILLPDSAKDFENFSINTLVLKDEDGKYVYNKIIVEISKSTLFRNVGINLLNNLKENEDFKDAKEILDLLNIEAFKNLNQEEFYDEMISLFDIVNCAIDMNLIDSEEYNITEDNIELLINKIFASSLIKGNESNIIDYILEATSLNEQLTELGIEISYDNVNWDTEPTKIINIIKSVLKFGDINSLDLEKIFENRDEETNQNIVNLFVSLRNSQIFEPIMFDLLDKVVENLEYEEITNLLNFNALKDSDSETFEKEINNLLEIIDLIENSGLTNDEFNLNNETVEQIKPLITKVFDSILIQGNETSIIDYILEQTGLSSELEKMEITVSYENVNWDSEPNNLINVIDNLLKFGDLDSFDLVEIFNERDETKNQNIVDLFIALRNSQIFEPIMFDILNKNIDEIGYEEVTKYFDFNKLKPLDDDEFEIEIKKILDLIDIMGDCGLNGEIALDKTKVDELINNLYSSILIDGNEAEITNYLFDEVGLNSSLESLGITINVYDETIDWETEPNAISNILKALLDYNNISDVDIEKLMENRTSEDEQKLINLFNSLDKSQIFNHVTFTIVENMIKNVDKEISISDEEKEKIRTNTWNKEISVLFDTIDKVQTLLTESSYETIKGTEVTRMMMLASEGVLSSKVIGNALNDMLGEDNLNINPKENGVYKYDFTDPVTLETQAESIGNLLDLRRLVNDNETSQADVVSNVIEVVKSLENDDITSDLLNTIFVDSTIDGEIDFNEEAELIESSYAQYTENGTVSSEKLEELENSKLASEVLKKLGIID